MSNSKSSGHGGNSGGSNSRTSTIKGTSGNDVLVGTEGKNKILGRAGDDTLIGNGGDDRLHGGRGNDTLSGGAGNDKLKGGKGNDALDGGPGNDRLKGNSGDDVLLGSAGADKLSGGAGNDTLDGGAGSDRVNGDSGNDVLVYRMSENNAAHDRYDGGSGCDTLRLELTGAEWARADVRADVARFLAWLDGSRHGGGHGHHDDNHDRGRDRGHDRGEGHDHDHGSWNHHGHGHQEHDGGGRWFEFRVFDLDVRHIEKLEIRVDGIVVDPGGGTVDALNDAAVSDEDGSVGGNVVANDSVPAGVDRVELVSGPAEGALVLNADGSYTYTPGVFFDSLAEGELATQSFVYRVTDTGGASDTASVTITIAGSNDAPVLTAQDLAGAVTELGEPAGDLSDAGMLAFRDVDLSDVHLAAATPLGEVLGALSATLEADTTGSGSGGQLSWSYSIAASDAEYLAEGETRVESFVIALDDQHGGLIERQIDVTITGTNDAPVAGDDEVTGTSGPSTSVAVVYETLSPAILAAVDQLNDDTWFNFSASAVHYSDADSAAELAPYDAVLLGNSSVEQFSADFWAALRQYVESDEGGVASNGFINFSLGEVSARLGAQANADYDATTPVTGDYRYAAESGPLVGFGVSHPITAGLSGVQAYSWVAGSDQLDPGAVSLATVADGRSALAYRDSAGAGRTVYLGFQFTDSEYRDAGMADSVEGDRLLEQALGWAARASIGGDVTEDAPATIAAPDLLVNDSDADASDVLSIVVVSASEQGAALEVTAGGDVRYDPTEAFQHLAEGESAGDRFTYTVSDGHGGASTASVAVKIVGRNDAPVITSGDQTGSASEGDDGASRTAAGRVSFDDPDVSDSHVFTVSSAAYGEASVDQDGNWTYSIVDEGEIDALAVGEQLFDAFTVTVEDPYGALASQDVSVTIVGTNDAPQGGNDVVTGSAGMEQGAPISVAVVYQDLSASISAAVDQLNDDSRFDFSASAVHYSAADSAPELAQYDVVLLGNSALDTFSAEFWAALRQYVEDGEGGVVSNGWTSLSLGEVNLGLGAQANADYDAVTPITGDYFYNSEFARFVEFTGSHAITDGLGGLQADRLVATSFLLDPGAVSLAAPFDEEEGDSALAYQDQPGEGRTVYLGFHYTDRDDRDWAMAASEDGDRLLEQALGWASGREGAATDEDTPLTIASSRLLANDRDVDLGDVLSIDSVSATSALGASVTLDVDGNVRYDPTAVLQHLVDGDRANDSFTYVVSDGHGGFGTASVTLTVAGLDEAALTLIGSDGGDALIGGAGDDFITGAGGDDVLTGGAGADAFIYESIDDGHDTITDFTPGAGGDALDIRDLLTGYSAAQASDFIALETSGADAVVSVDGDGAASGAFFTAIATLEGQAGLLLSDLLANNNLIVS